MKSKLVELVEYYLVSGINKDDFLTVGQSLSQLIQIVMSDSTITLKQYIEFSNLNSKVNIAIDRRLIFEAEEILKAH